MSDLLTAEEVALKLKVHVKTVYANREIPRVQFGGSVRWRESDIDAYLQTRVSRKAAPHSIHNNDVMRHKLKKIETGGR